MNVKELERKLVAEGCSPRSYSLVDERVDEALCLRARGDGWEVYYSERGLESGKEHFATESAACAYFLEAMKSDPTTRTTWRSGFSFE